MALSYHAFGACTPQVGTGAAGALEALGVATENGSVLVTHASVRVMSDAAGNQVPAEIQQMGSLARIEIQLTTWDDAVLTKLLAAQDSSITEGVAGIAGTLMGTGGFLKSLYLPSVGDLPWYFPTARLIDSGHNPGTEYGRRKLTFEALRWLPGTALSSDTYVLYTRAAPP